MTGRVFLHVGPPKTGTTSLQLALQQLALPRLHYVGVSQPRADFENADIRLLSAISKGTVTFASEPARTLRSTLEERITSGDTVVISEEMFVVANDEATIRKQLRNVVEFLGGLPLTAVVTLRDPRAAIPSYFQEIYSSLPIGLTRNLDSFARDGRNFCYDYFALCEFIEALEVDIQLADFNRIAAGSASLAVILGPNCDIDGDLNFPKANSSRFGATDETRFIPKADLINLSRSPAIRALIDRAHLKKLPGWSSLRRIARRIPLQPESYRRLRLDQIVAERFVASFEQARQRWNPEIPPLDAAPES